MSVTINGNGTVTGLTALPASAMSTGSIIQVVSTTRTTPVSETLSNGATSSSDISGLQVTLTPSSSSNKILLTCTLTISAYDLGFVFSKDGSVISGAIGDADGSKKRVYSELYLGSGYTMHGTTLHYVDTAGGTSAITYGVRIRNTDTASRTWKLNQNIEARSVVNKHDTVGASTITAMEIKA